VSHQTELGHGKALRLQVMDVRPVTNRFGQLPLAPEQPLAGIVEQAFRVALSRANYVLSDSSDVTYEVKIMQFDADWGNQILSTPIRTAVSLRITVLKDGRPIGSKAVGQTKEALSRFHNDLLGRTSEALSAAMSDAIHQAVQDTTLNFLLRRPDGVATTADAASTLAPPRREAAAQPEKVAEVEPPPVTLTGADAELEERQWNQALLKNTAQAYLEYYKTYTNTGRMKMLTGTLTAQMGMELSFGPRSDGPNVKKVILSMDQHPGFRQEISVEEAARWKIINYKPLGNGAAKIGTKDPMPNATVILVKQRSSTAAAKTEFKVVAIEAGGAQAKLLPSNPNSTGQESALAQMPSGVRSKFLAATSIDFHSLLPAPEAVVNNPGKQTPRRHISAARSEDKKTLVIYVPEDRVLEIQLTAMPESPHVNWFNPRTSDQTPAVAVIGDATAQFPTPSEGDWVLLIDARARPQSVEEGKKIAEMNKLLQSLRTEKPPVTVLKSDTNILKNTMVKIQYGGTTAAALYGTVTEVLLQEILNGNKASTTLKGQFIKLVGGVPIFRTGNGLAFVFYPRSGHVLPCFPEDSIGDTKSLPDTFVRAWAASQFRDMSNLVAEASKKARNGDVDSCKLLGVIAHPDSGQELLNLKLVPDQALSAAATDALAVWEEMRSAVILAK